MTSIIRGNQIIAKFMGAKLILNWVSPPIYTDPEDTFDFGDTPPTEYSSRYWLANVMYYHEDLNWLIPVMKKIESMDENIHFNIDDLKNKSSDYVQECLMSKWKSCVDFIQNLNNV